MAIYKVINEENETLNESGGAHQKLIELRKSKRNDIEKWDRRLYNLDNFKSDLKNKKDQDVVEKFKDKLKKSNFYKNKKDGTEAYVPSSKYQAGTTDVDNLKDAMHVGKKHAERNERKPGLYKKLQDIKRNEAFDMCADYVVGCLEGSVDEFDLDLFTEASAFIIDCLNEDEE
jgi:hypothetical protein